MIILKMYKANLRIWKKIYEKSLQLYTIKSKIAIQHLKIELIKLIN